MHTTLLIIQSILCIFIIVAILLQSRGTGFGSSWSGSSTSFHTRRGVEKVLFNGTIVLIALFAVVSIAVLKTI